MKTFEEEYENFYNEYNIFIDDYNNINNCNMELELNEFYNSILTLRPKLTLSSFFKELKSIINNIDDIENTNIFILLSCVYNNPNKTNSLLQDYFNDVKQIYDNLPEDNLEFNEENREHILNSNLKMVISTAKRYRNRGLSLEELICAGNEGLCKAWEKYKPQHNVLRNKLIEELNNSPEQLSKEYIDFLVTPFVKYGDLKSRYDEYFSKDKTYDNQEVIKWVNKNIKKAKFSSVAALWIRAYILQELNNNSRVVKKPKSEIDKDFEKHGSYLKETLLTLDPIIDAEDKSNYIKIQLKSDDNIDDDIDHQQNMINFKIKLNNLLKGINNRDRRILFKSFGIGLPRSLEAKEIAESEELGVARVSQIVQDCIEKMKSNSKGQDIDDFLKYLNN